MKKNLNFVLMLVVMAITSCSKKEVKPTPEQIIVGKYKLTGEMITENGVTTNKFLTRPACVADDIVEFMADGKVIYTSGATKCSATDDDYQGTYTLPRGGKLLSFKFVDAIGTSEYGYEVRELTSKILKYGNSVLLPNGTAFNEEYIYTKI